MTAVIVIGSGWGSELMTALRDTGVTLIVADRLPAPPDPFELGERLLIEAMRPLAPERPQFYPETRPNLPKSASWQVRGMQRTGRRPREHRTRNK